MQPSAENPDISSSFAGALAAFTAETGGCGADPGDGLTDDVAVFSDESTLRAQAGRGPDDPPLDEAGAIPDGSNSNMDFRVPEPQDTTLKSASITIRMSEAECLQLRKRAAEAGISVSAYVRSCTLEAEALRVQVKQALAELRAAAPEERSAAAHAPRRWWRYWPPPWPHARARSARA